jgi:pSer/pThr/pTyr-binding forkhead associated (FHA) protein
MKVSLVVLTEGKYAGKEIPITFDRFLIGRAAECNLRPSSQLISKLHCGVLTRGERLFVKDFESTNGTFINNERLVGEKEVRDRDELMVGPLSFRIALRGAVVPINEPTPVPTKTPAEADEEELAGTLLLSSLDKAPPSGAVDEQGVPLGSTVLDRLGPAPENAADATAQNKKPDDQSPATKTKEEKAKAAAADTSAAASAILTKYLRRPRGQEK